MATIIHQEQQAKSCWNTIGVWGKQFPRCEKLGSVIHCRNCDVFITAGRRVFDRELPPGYLEQWTNVVSQQIETAPKDSISAICLRLGNEWFAIPTKLFKEVSGVRKLHRIPHQLNSFVLGVINIGGAIQVCFSLAELLNVTRHSKETRKSSPRYIVLSLDGISHVFPVDEIGGVFRYSTSQLREVPDTLSPTSAELLLGIVEFNGNKISCINVRNLQQAMEQKISEQR